MQMHKNAIKKKYPKNIKKRTPTNQENVEKGGVNGSEGN
jgi:hypothetical protein